MTTPSPAAVWRWLLGIAVVAHLLALYWPGSPDAGPIDVPHLDKAVHVALFAVPAYLARRVTTRWWPIVLLAVHAPLSELIQWRFIGHRSGDPLDLVADFTGLALGVLAARRPRAAVSPSRA